jgi:hypothetical protein
MCTHAAKQEAWRMTQDEREALVRVVKSLETPVDLAGLVRHGVLKRRGAWHEVLVDMRFVPEHAGRRVQELKQITRRQGRTILARTTLIKFRRGMRVSADAPAGPDQPVH